MSQDQPEVAKCPQCGGPLRPYHEGPLRGKNRGWQRCDYCGYYDKTGPIQKLQEEVGTTGSIGVGLIGIVVTFGIMLLVLNTFASSNLIGNSTITAQFQKSLNLAFPVFLFLVPIAFMLVVIGYLTKEDSGKEE